MKIIEKISRKANDRQGNPAVTVAFFGDSITEGCFDVYIDDSGKIATYVDQARVYHTVVKEIFGKLYPACPVNIINAGISGANAKGSVARLERDVISHRPDLTVVSFGSNDMLGGDEGLGAFSDAMSEIVNKLVESGSEVIVMSAPMNCTRVSGMLHDKELRDIAKRVSDNVNGGILKKYCEAAGEVAKGAGVPFLDMYSRWEKLQSSGVDIDSLLENHINHPGTEMHRYTAMLLVECMFNA